MTLVMLGLLLFLAILFLPLHTLLIYKSFFVIVFGMALGDLFLMFLTEQFNTAGNLVNRELE